MAIGTTLDVVRPWACVRMDLVGRRESVASSEVLAESSEAIVDRPAERAGAGVGTEDHPPRDISEGEAGLEIDEAACTTEAAMAEGPVWPAGLLTGAFEPQAAADERA
jgi:hypothetical protein